MAECVFCDIVAGKVSATTLETDSVAIVILDQNQAARGHLLILPKNHVAHWHELEDETAAHLGRLARRWAAALKTAFAPDGYNILVNNGRAAGQDVFHVHLHITPRSSDDGYYVFGGKKTFVTEDDSKGIARGLIAGLNVK